MIKIKHTIWPVLLSLLFTSAFFTSLASADEATEGQLSKIAHAKQWLHLLHYHQVGLLARNESQVDDPKFFLSTQGKRDPLSELKATIAALSETSPNYQSNRCRYPARAEWLSSQLDTNFRHDNEHCKELSIWLNEISAQGLTLIFPAAYLNSPSSMFGHTLMRIDSNKHKSKLLSYSINYAANADPNDNELVFSYKGLTGGYPGLFSILPYYLKVKEYNYLESRDVWEYELDITKEELTQFMLHAWEIKDASFDYYFFTENCSYHLLTLLDAASPRFDLARAFSTDVIPADTVRVLQEGGYIKRTEFRPSMQTSLSHQLAHSSELTHDYALMLTDSDKPVSTILSEAPLSLSEQAQALELAVALARYKAKQQANEARRYNQRSIKLLSARSKISDVTAFTKTPRPTTRDDEGHRSHRWLSRTGHDQRGNYVGLDLRMSYHDFLDPADGYIPGALLELIHFKFKAYPKRESAELEAFRAINIASLAPRNQFIQPTSWFVQTGLERNHYQVDELMPYLRAGPGLSYRLANADGANVLASVLLSNQLYLDNDIAKGYTFGSGPLVRLLYQSTEFNISAHWQKHYDLYGAEFGSSESYLGVGVPLESKFSLRGGMHYKESNWSNAPSGTRYDVNGEIGLAWYF